MVHASHTDMTIPAQTHRQTRRLHAQQSGRMRPSLMELQSLFSEVNVFFLRKGLGTSFVAQTVKNLPAMQETWVRSLGWEDLLQKGMVIHSSVLAWRNPRTEEHNRLQSTGSQRVRRDWPTNTSTWSSG